MSDTPSTDVAFRSLVEATIEEIRRYCVRRLPMADVDDASSEVYLVAWRRRDKLPQGSDALPWLYAVARNVVRNIERTNRRTTRLRARMAVQPAAPVEGNDVQVVRREEDQALLEAISRLGEADQEVIKLRAWERLSAAEIAMTLSCSESAAHKRVSRALGRLQRAYGEIDAELQAGYRGLGGAS